MTQVSVVIITKNEAENIGRCIQSCQNLNAEILVLDSQSEDDTVTIATNLGAVVHSIDWLGYGATKNKGADLAKHKWILSLDADEALDEVLQNEITDALSQENKAAAYWLSRTFIFDNKKIKHGAYKNEKRLRLYDKTKMRWNNVAVHESLEAIDKTKNLKTDNVNGTLLHYSYKNEEGMEARLEKYARLSAKKLSAKGSGYLQLKKILSPGFSFVKNYLLKGGCLDGKSGFILAKAQARYIRKKYQYTLDNLSN